MGSFEAKEQENCVADECRRDSSESVHEQVELRLLEAVLLKPLEHLLFVHQISAINGREAAPEVHHRRELVDTVFARVTYVPDFDKGNVQIISFGIDIFQFVQYLLAFRAIIFI